MRSKIAKLFTHSGSKVITPRLIQQIEDQNVCLPKTIINWVLMLVAEARDTLRALLSAIFICCLKKQSKASYEVLQRFTLNSEE